MGYRSDVKSVIEFGTREQAVEYYHVFDPKHCLYSQLKVEDRFLVFEEDAIKWYEDYPEIAECFSYLSESTCAPGFVSWEFIRVGEDADDVEEYYEGEVTGILGLERIITMNWRR